MALTKAQVREILSEAGIEKENMKDAVEKIIDGHLASIDVLREEADTQKKAAEDAKKELDDLKAKGDGGWKDKYEKEHKAFEDYKTDQAAKEAHGAKEKAYRALLQEVGISEKRLDSVLRLCDVDGVELDEKGAIKDAGKLKDSLKTEWADFVVTKTTEGANTPTPPVNNPAQPAANSRAAQIAAEMHRSLYGEVKKE